MGHWDDIRAQARAKRAEILEQAAQAGQQIDQNSLITAADLLELAETASEIPRIALPSDDPLLYGAQAWLSGDPGDQTIYYNEDMDPAQAALVHAHEYAHLWLHLAGEITSCSESDLDPAESESALATAADKVQGYGPRERREREANLYAREFLLPASALAVWYRDGGMRMQDIASVVGLPESAVAQQLAYALLTPVEMEINTQDAPKAAGPTKTGASILAGLDSSQARAAQAESGPVLVEAGPGTGKTSTLVGRVLFLLEKGISPTSILALTFSNKAAEEMRSRVAQVAPDAAPLIWMGTFHAFGMELLRKHHEQANLPPGFGLIEGVDAVLALESALERLALKHYMNLYQPTMYLRDILGAISRAKDELVSASKYAELAHNMLAQATSEEEVIAAEKAQEIARAYEVYQEHLHSRELVDFGDLIFRAVEMLRAEPEVRDFVRRSYSHILVDEYQDVNRASGLLLGEVAGNGRGLWAVGDARQAIYRFRGAAPANMHLFHVDFPGAIVLPLKVNYRSQPPIVETFAAFAPHMQAARPAEQALIEVPQGPLWQANRPATGGRVAMEIAPDERAETELIAREIKQQHEAGVLYREQAILCRSHSTLALIGSALEEQGIPVLYLGNLFERPEIRDLLSVLALACGDSSALVRVARFPEYNISLLDVQLLLNTAKELNVHFPRAFRLAESTDDISEAGKRGFALLADHLEGAAHNTLSAWTILCRYLFSESAYLRPMLENGSVAGQQRRLAIFQFIQFALDLGQRPVPERSERRKYLLEYVRQLEQFGEGNSFSQLPDWAEHIDAVRLLTVHASKGLEFSAVYLPKLGARHFPSSRKPAHCPPPKGMLSGGDADWHEEEEECLFFVALSRARDTLFLSRAERYGAQNSKASRMLTLIKPHLPRDPGGPVTWSGDSTPAKKSAASSEYLTEARPVYTAAMLEQYMQCPRRFYYDQILQLGAVTNDAPYLKFHRAVHLVLDWIKAEEAANHTVRTSQADEQLTEVWDENGPVGHAHEAIYLEQARKIIARALDQRIKDPGFRRPTRQKEDAPWVVPLAHGDVEFAADDVQLTKEEESGLPVINLKRQRTGKPSKSEKEANVYALYFAAAAEKYPEARIQVQTVYLSEERVDEVALSGSQVKTRLDRYDQAMEGISRGDFHPEPSDRDCPRCPHYFICPIAEEL